ncbi:MAG: hypothetical protein J7576_24345 [Siphonobacter aquaeclarae]|nr:hypothetical protein [Siphonobacter aquaeclarae]
MKKLLVFALFVAAIVACNKNNESPAERYLETEIEGWVTLDTDNTPIDSVEILFTGRKGYLDSFKDTVMAPVYTDATGRFYKKDKFPASYTFSIAASFWDHRRQYTLYSCDGIAGYACGIDVGKKNTIYFVAKKK